MLPNKKWPWFEEDESINLVECRLVKLKTDNNSGKYAASHSLVFFKSESACFNSKKHNLNSC